MLLTGNYQQRTLLFISLKKFAVVNYLFQP